MNDLRKALDAEDERNQAAADDKILEDDTITDEGAFANQLSKLYPALQRRFLSRAKLYLRGIKGKFQDFEECGAVTANGHALTTFISISMAESYTYAHVVEEQAQDVPLPRAEETLGEMFELLKQGFVEHIATIDTFLPGSYVAVRHVFRFVGDKRLCFLIIGLTDQESLEQIANVSKNEIFSERDYDEAEKLIHSKIAERVKNEIDDHRTSGSNS